MQQVTFVGLVIMGHNVTNSDLYILRLIQDVSCMVITEACVSGKHYWRNFAISIQKDAVGKAEQPQTMRAAARSQSTRHQLLCIRVAQRPIPSAQAMLVNQ